MAAYINFKIGEDMRENMEILCENIVILKEGKADKRMHSHEMRGCKVVIYNYVLCWLYFMTKSVVIALILFLVFCGILLYWV